VSVAIPVRIRYKNGGNNDSSTVDLSGASNVITDFHLNILQGTNTQGPAMDSFEIIPIKGTIKVESLAPAAAKEILFVEGSDSFYVKFAIVARAKGVYALAIVDLFQARKDCIDASVSIVYANTDQHLHYLQDIYDGGGPIDPLDQTHSYCFKVY
jgi:hypothetical protein